ncbi:ABC-type transporter, integral membrane subunit [Thiorhodococcus drewsii AZ1]|uniref:ABC-type transporter, integral membrane subunit n=1 Tax=Thiorhodococcus drewsii AZ1 TaxID=765913 RepID=G2DX28_9GAMM|nr:ABC transporter permease [Thiorhodococcus drewsii]EGV33382.1 ABC-type transporter, integral membrane subunit [Thiorhodococcus drewsii AZ1]
MTPSLPAQHPLALRLASALSLILLWQWGAWQAQSNLLPTPSAVLDLAWGELVHGPLLEHLGATLRRVVLAFCIAMLVGGTLGGLMGRLKTLDAILDPWLVLLLNIPALVIIILAFVWFGLNETTAVIAIALNKIPNVMIILREGARTLDPDFREMAQSFRLGWRKTLLYVTLPQLLPYIAVAARSGLALIWKIVLVVELLGRNDGIGFMLHTYFQLFDVTGILAYSLSFILVMLGIEYALLQPLERLANRWRR